MISGLITGTLDQQNGTDDGDETRFASIGQTRHWSKPVLFVGRLVWLQPAMGQGRRMVFSCLGCGNLSRPMETQSAVSLRKRAFNQAPKPKS